MLWQSDCNLFSFSIQQRGLKQFLEKDGAYQLSTVIDAGGGDIMAKASPLLKMGGRVVVYGMRVFLLRPQLCASVACSQ